MHHRRKEFQDSQKILEVRKFYPSTPVQKELYLF